MSPPPNSAWRLPLRASNAYLVADGELTLIDAGTPWDADRVRALLARGGFAPADVDRVLLTHFDLDHVGSLADLGLDLDAPVYAADPDAAFLAGEREPPLDNEKGALQRAVDFLLSRPENPLRRVEDGDRIGEFVAHRTPGHTPGHVAYHHEPYDVLFAGDLVRSAAGRLVAPPAFIAYDADENAASVRSLAERFPDVDAVAPGHGDPIRANGGRTLARLAAEL